MFEIYSKRALQVIFIARLKAGQCGARMMDVEHLLAALIMEDQGGPLAESLTGILLGEDWATGTPSVISEPYPMFFSSDAASKLLSRIEEILPHSQPISASDDLPISSRLQDTLEAAKQLQEKLQQKQVEPLGLLVAALAEKSSEGARIFQEAGITQEQILAAIQEKAR